jgi:periplasmic protein TonB
VIVDRRLLACAALSILGHLALTLALRHLPRRSDEPARRVVSIRVIAPPPAAEPPPEPPPPPEKAAPKPVPHERARARPAVVTAPAAAPQDAPPPDRPPAAGDVTTTPMFGVTMESTSQAGKGPAMPVGNSARPSAVPKDDDRASATPLAAPVPAYEVTTMPLPQGRCAGKYTDEAKQAAVEGTVVLDLIVSETGRVRDVQVVSGLAHGLTEAAILAVKQCHFSPGEKEGTPVPVRVRGFKIRFVLQNDE